MAVRTTDFRAPGHDILRRLRRREVRAAYLFILPSLVVLAVFVLYPIIDVFWLSLHQYSILDPAVPFVGLRNFVQLHTDGQFWISLRNTAIYTVVTIPVTLVLAVAVALGLNERLPAHRFLRSAYFLPGISSLAVMGLVWSYLLNPEIGTISYWSSHLGLPTVNWLQSTTWALPAVMFVGVWRSLGFGMVIILAGLQGISETYYEAAKIDGASAWGRFVHVTIPGLRPTLLFVLVTSVIGSVQVFDQVYVMTRGGPEFSTETLVSYMYNQAFEFANFSYASAIAVVLFVIVLIVSTLELRFFRYSDVD